MATLEAITRIVVATSVNYDLEKLLAQAEEPA